MNTTTDTPAMTPWTFNKPIISEAGLDGTLLQLGPKAELTLPSVARQRVFFVASGSVTISSRETNYMLGADGILTVMKDRPITIRNHTDDAAKLLELTLPAPRTEWKIFVPDEGLPTK